jgi:hypothetical protein
VSGRQGPAGARGTLVLLSRPGCGLCEEMHEELLVLAGRLELPPLEILDITSDPELERRYLLEIPVLLLDGVAVSRVQLDPDALEQSLRRRSGGPSGPRF